MRRRLTRQQIQHAQRLQANGISQHDIANTLGIPYQLLSITLAKERTNTSNGNPDSENLRRMRQNRNQQTLL